MGMPTRVGAGSPLPKEVAGVLAAGVSAGSVVSGTPVSTEVEAGGVDDGGVVVPEVEVGVMVTVVAGAPSVTKSPVEFHGPFPDEVIALTCQL